MATRGFRMMTLGLPEHLASVQHCTNTNSVNTLLADYIRDLGADHVSFATGLDNSSPSIAHTFPQWAMDYYIENIHPIGDPRVAKCRHGNAPVFAGVDFWDRWPHLPQAIRHFDEEMCTEYARGVIFVPVHSINSAHWGVLAFCSNLGAEQLEKLYAQVSGPVMLAANAAFNRIEELSKPQLSPCVRLSEREREALLWLARGERNSRIAERLGVKPVTVEYFLATARRKLNAKTREQALAKALQQGQICP